jgi:hypothetical protein
MQAPSGFRQASAARCTRTAEIRPFRRRLFRGLAALGSFVPLAGACLLALPAPALAGSGRASSGIVTDLAGRPIAGADVCAFTSIGGGLVRCAITNTEGVYAIEGLETGEYKVEFSATGYVTQFYKEQPSLEKANPVAVTAGHTTSGIDAALVKASQGKVSGTVTKASGGAFSGAEVCAFTAAGAFEECVFTNPEGNYTIERLVPGEYKIEFAASGFITQFYKEQPSLEKANPVTVTSEHTTSGINASMGEGGKITGTVTKAGGGAITGAEACADTVNGAFVQCAFTNSEGKYTLSALASGEYKVEFIASGFITQFYKEQPSLEKANAVTVAAEQTTSGINASMREGGKITGTVTKAGGGAITGAEACADTLNGAFVQCAFTNSEGKYTLSGLASGEYKIEFIASGFITQFYKEQPSLEKANAVTVAAEQTTSGINASMAEGGKISGTVTKAGGGAVSGIEVCANTVSFGFGGCAITNSEGKYTIEGLMSGEYKVEFFGSGFITQFYKEQPSFEKANPVTVTSGSTTSGINATLVQAGGISGTVRQAGGGAVSSAEVCADTLSGAFVQCAFTNSEGKYTLSGLASGEYKIEFLASGFITQFYKEQPSLEKANPVSVVAEHITTEINATLAKAAEGKISGTVSAVGGSPLSGADACADSVSGTFAGCALTNAEGKYTIEGLAPGEYKVEFSGTDFITQFYKEQPSFEKATPVTVTNEHTTPGIDASLVEGGKITGTVTEAGGVPKKTTTLTTSLSGEGKSGETLTVKEGQAVTDSATLSGENAATAGGTVTYKAYSDKECKTLAKEAGTAKVTAGAVGASESETLSPGTYYWQASYSGDETNQASVSTCGAEVLTVQTTAVKVTATCGNTAVGKGADGLLANRKRVNRCTLPGSATVTEVSIYLSPGAPSGEQLIEGVVYADSHGQPGALLGVTEQLAFTSSSPAGWYHLALATPLALSAGQYWIGLISGATANVADEHFEHTGAAEDYNANSYASGPSDPFGHVATSGEQMSLYATYEPVGPQVFGNTVVGRFADEFIPNRKRVNHYTLPLEGSVSKLTVYLAPTGNAGQQVLQGVIYADAGGKPEALLGTSEPLTFKSSDAAGWYDLPLSVPLKLAAGSYWIGVFTGPTSHVAGFRFNSVPASRDFNANPFSSGPSDPFGAFSTDSEQMSLFATYETEVDNVLGEVVKKLP